MSSPRNPAGPVPAAPSPSLVTRTSECLTAPDPDLRRLRQRGQHGAAWSARGSTPPHPLSAANREAFAGAPTEGRAGSAGLLPATPRTLILTLGCDREGEPDRKTKARPTASLRKSPSRRDLGRQRKQAALRHAGGTARPSGPRGLRRGQDSVSPDSSQFQKPLHGAGRTGRSAKGSGPASSLRLREGGRRAGPLVWTRLRLLRREMDHNCLVFPGVSRVHMAPELTPAHGRSRATAGTTGTLAGSERCVRGSPSFLVPLTCVSSAHTSVEQTRFLFRFFHAEERSC